MKERKKYSRQYLQTWFALPGILLFLFSTPPSFAQLSYGGRPASLTAKSIREIPVIRMPVFDVSTYIREQEALTGRDLKKLVFARSFELLVDPSSDGAWTELQNGTRVWRVALQSRGAFSINLIFSRFRIEPGVKVFVYDTGQSDIRGAFDSRNNRNSASLALSPVRGDKVIVEMQVAAGVADYGELVIGRLNHDFIDIFDLKQNKSGTARECNIDINCPPGDAWQTQKNAVVRITINGNSLCTGVLVNNTSNDGKPYLLTANHCIGDSTDAANSVFIFGYESPFCNGGDGSIRNSLSGSAVVAAQSNLDFTLVLLEDIPPLSYRPWYAGWDRTGETPDNTTSVHHPSGSVKKISLDYDQPVTGTFGAGFTQDGHWLVKHWDIGTTEYGSSGSPLFNQDGRLKGTLTGGRARCGFAEDDYFSKFSLAWDLSGVVSSQLKPWLDPLETEAEKLDGLNPYRDNELAADFTVSTTEICLGDKVVFSDFSTGDIDNWHWDFGEGADPPDAVDRGPHLVKYSGSGQRTASLTVENPEGSATAELQFDLAVKSEDLPVAGFSYEEDMFSVQFIDMSQNAVSYYWEFSDSRISTLVNPVNTFSTEGEFTARQLVRNRACSDTSVQAIIVTSRADISAPAKKVMVYPVPAVNFLTIDTRGPLTQDIVIELLTVGGQRLFRNEIPAGQSLITLDTGRYPPGTYILNISSGNDQFNFKIPIIK
jgi:lysyl endopeptidase